MDLAALEERLGHRFRNRALLVEALTHASAQGEGAVRDNERLEFLGDRVLGLLASEILLERYPESREGDLAPRLNALVRKERCAAVARELGLGRFLILSDGEAKLGRGPNTAILADACEAVLAAIYIDAGLDRARAFFRSAWADAIGEVHALPQDAKSALQEWTQERALGLPSYALAGREGPAHRPAFTVTVAVSGMGDAKGTGSSKRAAEQAAATAFLVHHEVWTAEEAERAGRQA